MTYRLIAALLILSRAALPSPSQSDPLTLIAAGTRRQLLAPVFGASTTQFYERLFEDPGKMATLKTMAIGREPTSEEIAKKMDMPVSKVRKIIKLAQQPISLETPIGEEGGGPKDGTGK